MSNCCKKHTEKHKNKHGSWFNGIWVCLIKLKNIKTSGAKGEDGHVSHCQSCD